MPVTEHAAGAPCWYELFDPTGHGARFYQRILGWTMTPYPREVGDYTVCTSGGAPVAGIERRLVVSEGAARWIVYFRVQRLSEVLSAIAVAGGLVLAGPAGLAGAGRYVIARDPSNALFGLWEPCGHIGVGAADRRGAPCWANLNVARGDGRRAAEFYATTLGLDFEELSGDDWELRVAGSPVAAIRERTPIQEASWVPFFRIDDDSPTLRRWTENAPGTWRAATPRGDAVVIQDPLGAAVGFVADATLYRRAANGNTVFHGGRCQ